MNINQQIHYQRKARQLSIRELARRAHISPGNLSEIERGLKRPLFETVLKIARGLAMSLDTLASIQLRECPTCQGTGRLFPDKPKSWCHFCGGRGVVAYHETGYEVTE